MVTAYGREEVLKQAENNSFASVLVKPVTASMLFDSAIQVLGESHDRVDDVQASSGPWTSNNFEGRACCWWRTTS